MAEEQGQRASTRAATAPDPNDSRKPDSPTKITKPSWSYVLRKTAREFSTDQVTDLSASLTYYGTLAVFPALLAFISILGLFGNARKTTDSLLQLLTGVVPSSTLESVRAPIDALTHSSAAGIGLVVGILGALLSASGYVRAFARAMNRIYGIQEGRPIWKLRPLTLGITVVVILAAVLAALLLVISGPIAQQVGSNIGVGGTLVIVWDIVKWPILLIIAILVVALLYYATPNIKQPKFRWMSMGSLVALFVWAAASVGFAFYAANFSKYNSTYGSIGGIIIFLLWVWISNNAILFGAELDAEIERGRELQAGIEAEETLQLPPRDTRQSDKKAKQHEKDVQIGRELRLSRGDSADTPDADKGEDSDQEKDGDHDIGRRAKRRRRKRERAQAKAG
jgi:membrane protein